jgi:integrase
MTWVDTKDARIKKRNGVYWARFSRRGKRVEQSLEIKSFEVAKRLTDDLEARVLAGKGWKRERQLFKDAWTEFLRDKHVGDKVEPAREKTLKEYIAFGERFYLPAFGEMRLSDVNEDAWREFVRKVQVERGEIQFANIRKYMMGFFTWALAHERLDERPYLFNPDAKADQEREEYEPGKAYTLDELKRLREAAATYSTEFRTFVYMAQYMGMRPSEITQLRKDRINFAKQVIILKKVDTKTKKGRTIPIHPKCMLKIEHQVARAGDSDFLFPHAHVHTKPNEPMDKGGFRRAWLEVLASVGLEGRVYDFRHTFITHAISSGMFPSVVAQITGTSVRIIEKHYLHLSPEDAHKQMRKLQL